MLLGRKGFLPFVLGWLAIVASLAVIMFAVFWLGGSFR